MIGKLNLAFLLFYAMCSGVVLARGQWLALLAGILMTAIHVHILFIEAKKRLDIKLGNVE